MAGKVFKQAQNVDPIWFEIEVKPGPDGKPRPNVRFDCEDDIPGGVMFAFSGEDEEPGSDGEPKLNMVAAAKSLFDSAVVEDQKELFWDMVYGRRRDLGVIGLTQMLGIAEYIAGSYAARPTGESSDDGSPRTPNGSPSRGGARQEVSTYSRSPHTELSTS